MSRDYLNIKLNLFLLLIMIGMFSFKFYPEILTNVSTGIYEAYFLEFFKFNNLEVMTLYGPITKIISMVAIKINETTSIKIGYIFSSLYYGFGILFVISLYIYSKKNFIYLFIVISWALFFLNGNMFVHFTHGYDEIIWLPFTIFVMTYLNNEIKNRQVVLSFVLLILLIQIKIIFSLLIVPILYLIYKQKQYKIAISIGLPIIMVIFLITNYIVGIGNIDYINNFIFSAKHPFEIYRIVSFVKFFIISLLPLLLLAVLLNFKYLKSIVLNIKNIIIFMTVSLMSLLQFIKVGGASNSILLPIIVITLIIFNKKTVFMAKIKKFHIIIITIAFSLFLFVTYINFIEYNNASKDLNSKITFIQQFNNEKTFLQGGGNYLMYKVTKTIQPPLAFLSEFDFKDTQKNRIILQKNKDSTMFSARKENINGPMYQKYFTNLVKNKYFDKIVLSKDKYLNDEADFIYELALKNGYFVTKSDQSNIFLRKRQ